MAVWRNKIHESDHERLIFSNQIWAFYMWLKIRHRSVFVCFVFFLNPTSVWRGTQLWNSTRLFITLDQHHNSPQAGIANKNIYEGENQPLLFWNGGNLFHCSRWRHDPTTSGLYSASTHSSALEQRPLCDPQRAVTAIYILRLFILPLHITCFNPLPLHHHFKIKLYFVLWPNNIIIYWSMIGYVLQYFKDKWIKAMSMFIKQLLKFELHNKCKEVSV